MRTFDVQAVYIDAPYDRIFDYLADPATLPQWTYAFASVDGRRALMRTTSGETAVELDVKASREHGTIDWAMTFAGGETATAASRLVPHRSGAVYTFVLHSPPAPLEQLEGTLRDQSELLARELATLARALQRLETPA